MTLKKLHLISGLIITIFIGLHLFNHLVSILSIQAHIDTMEKLRVIYRNLIVECFLLLAVFIQIITGLRLFINKRKLVSSFYEKLQIWSGLYMAFFLLMHVGAILVGRYVLELDTNVYYGIAGLNTFPYNLYFIPYYGLAIILFFGHTAAIYSKIMTRTVLGISAKQQANFIIVVGVILTFIIFYGLTNGFMGVEIPTNYHILIGK